MGAADLNQRRPAAQAFELLLVPGDVALALQLVLACPAHHLRDSIAGDLVYSLPSHYRSAHAVSGNATVAICGQFSIAAQNRQYFKTHFLLW